MASRLWFTGCNCESCIRERGFKADASDNPSPEYQGKPTPRAASAALDEAI